MARIVTIDTNAYSAFMRGNEAVIDELSHADQVGLPLFVLGELHAGFRGGGRFQQNFDELRRFLAKPTVSLQLPSTETAAIFGELKNNLKKNGTPIPINDVWISSIAIETGSVLITYDHHFSAVPGLRLWEAIPGG